MRLLFVVDVQNLWYGAVEAFGRSARVDYKKLLRLVTHTEQQPITFYQSQAYIVTDKTGKQDVFSQVMESFGYTVFKNEVPPDGDKDQKEAWRQGMLENVIRSLTGNQIFCLATGNSDFTPVVKEARNLNMTTKTFCFPGDIAKELRDVSDDVVYLHKGILRDSNTLDDSIKFNGIPLS